MGKDIGFCSITEGICRKEGECETCSLRHIYVNIERYAKLHEQGRLIELPCKVGTEVFQVYADDCGNVPCLYGDCGTCKSAYWKIIETTFRTIHIEDFGKTVFLTKEEAEAKLKELEGVKG